MDDHLPDEKVTPVKGRLKTSEGVLHEDGPLENISQTDGALLDSETDLQAYSTNGENGLEETDSRENINDPSFNEPEKPEICSLEYQSQEQCKLIETEVPLLVTEVSLPIQENSPEKT